MDLRQALLDARVAEAAEAWLADPRDVAVYGRLVAAVEQRRRHLNGSDLSGSDDVSGSDRDERAARGAVAGTFAPPVVPSAAGDGGAAVFRHGEDTAFEYSGDAVLERVGDADLEHSGEPLHSPLPLGSRRAVRAVGADLEGDPAAVLRRLRGG